MTRTGVWVYCVPLQNPRLYRSSCSFCPILCVLQPPCHNQLTSFAHVNLPSLVLNEHRIQIPSNVDLILPPCHLRLCVPLRRFLAATSGNLPPFSESLPRTNITAIWCGVFFAASADPVHNLWATYRLSVTSCTSFSTLHKSFFQSWSFTCASFALVLKWAATLTTCWCNTFPSASSTTRANIGLSAPETQFFHDRSGHPLQQSLPLVPGHFLL